MNEALVGKSYFLDFEHVSSCASGKELFFKELLEDQEMEAGKEWPNTQWDKISNWVQPDDSDTGQRLVEYLTRLCHGDHRDSIDPYPGAPEAFTLPHLFSSHIHGCDDRAFIWRDVNMTWYKRPGRCMYMSRHLTVDELVQLKQEVNAALGISD